MLGRAPHDLVGSPPYQTAYSATKAFLVHFGCGLFREATTLPRYKLFAYELCLSLVKLAEGAALSL
jgi:hypothetical protein